MTEPAMEHRTFEASDGYPFHVAVWPAPAPPVQGPGRRPARRAEPFGLVSLAGPDAGRGGL